MNGENNEGRNQNSENSEAEDGLINQEDVELEERKAAIREGKRPMSDIYELKMVTAEEVLSSRMEALHLRNEESSETDQFLDPALINFEYGETSEDHELKEEEEEEEDDDDPYGCYQDLAILKSMVHYYFNLGGVIPCPISNELIFYIEVLMFPNLKFRGLALVNRIVMLYNHFAVVLSMNGGYYPEILHPVYREIFDLSMGLWINFRDYFPADNGDVNEEHDADDENLREEEGQTEHDGLNGNHESELDEEEETEQLDEGKEEEPGGNPLRETDEDRDGENDENQEENDNEEEENRENTGGEDNVNFEENRENTGGEDNVNHQNSGQNESGNQESESDEGEEDRENDENQEEKDDKVEEEEEHGVVEDEEEEEEEDEEERRRRAAEKGKQPMQPMSEQGGLSVTEYYDNEDTYMDVAILRSIEDFKCRTGSFTHPPSLELIYHIMDSIPDLKLTREELREKIIAIKKNFNKIRKLEEDDPEMVRPIDQEFIDLYMRLWANQTGY